MHCNATTEKPSPFPFLGYNFKIASIGLRNLDLTLKVNILNALCQFLLFGFSSVGRLFLNSFQSLTVKLLAILVLSFIIISTKFPKFENGQPKFLTDHLLQINYCEITYESSNRERLPPLPLLIQKRSDARESFCRVRRLLFETIGNYAAIFSFL